MKTATSKQGFILITVLWTLGLLTLLMLSFVVTSYNQRKATSNVIENARAEAFADAGVNIALLDLLKTARLTSDKWRFAHNGTPLTCQLEEKAVLHISVQDEEGKIDLNTANDGLLRDLIKHLNIDDDLATQYTDHIIDFRDADNLRRLKGAESEAYQKAGLSHGPKNFPFQHINELDQVLGLPQEVIQKLSPFVTVHSKRGGLDFSVAPKGISIKANLSNPQDNRANTMQIYRLNSRRRIFSISVQVQTDRDGHFMRRAIVLLTGQNEKPYTIRLWERGIGNYQNMETKLGGYEPC